MVSITYSHTDVEASAEDFERAYDFVELAIGAVDLSYEQALKEIEENDSVMLYSLNSKESAELINEPY